MERKYKDGVYLKLMFGAGDTCYARVNGYLKNPDGKELYNVLILTEEIDPGYGDKYSIEQKLLPVKEFETRRWKEITEEEFELEIEMFVNVAYQKINADEEKKEKLHKRFDEYVEQLNKKWEEYKKKYFNKFNGEYI